MERVPFGTEFSVSFNRADNFRVAGQRQNLYGEFVGRERGQAREWGFRLSTFNGRFELRSTHYQNDTLRNATPELTNSIALLSDMVSVDRDNWPTDTGTKKAGISPCPCSVSPKRIDQAINLRRSKARPVIAAPSRITLKPPSGTVVLGVAVFELLKAKTNVVLPPADVSVRLKLQFAFVSS
jgi:hypothetical protein